MGTATWSERHRAASEQLGSEREARWLVEEAAGVRWPAAAGEPVGDRAGARFDEMVGRRAGGEPLQYVLGRWAFRTLDLMVDRRVLIPRPETEQVVEVALAELDRVLSSRRLGAAPVVVDLGTGSGAIALSVAAERAGALVWATDASSAALEVARANTAGLGGRAATRVRLAEGRWWEALPPSLQGHVHLAVSNPPYVAAAEMAALDPVVRDWEPRDALEAGPTGMEDLTVILAAAPAWLAPGGSAVLEMAPHQADRLVAAAAAAGFGDVEVHPDLTGRDRVLVARR